MFALTAEPSTSVVKIAPRTRADSPFEVESELLVSPESAVHAATQRRSEVLVKFRMTGCSASRVPVRNTDFRRISESSALVVRRSLCEECRENFPGRSDLDVIELRN